MKYTTMGPESLDWEGAEERATELKLESDVEKEKDDEGVDPRNTVGDFDKYKQPLEEVIDTKDPVLNEEGHARVALNEEPQEGMDLAA